MTSRWKLRAAGAGAAVVLLLLAGPARSSASSVSQDQGSPGQVAQLWDSERASQARPLAPPNGSSRAVGVSRGEAPASETPSGPALAIPPTSPVNLLSPLVDFLVPDPSAYPNRLNGKLLFTTADGRDALCSASVVVASGKSLLFTAAHCVYNAEHGGWSTNVAFVPAYQAGSAPHGVWPAATWSVPQEWIDSGGEDLTYDLATINVYTDEDGTSIQDALGAWGIAFGASPDQYHKVIGYPVAPAPYDGEQMVGCDTAFLGYELKWTNAADGVVGVGPCGQANGASGAPFVTSGGMVQAVFSHRNCSEITGQCDTTSFGTYFGAAAQTLYNQTAGAKPVRRVTPAAGAGTSMLPVVSSPRSVPRWCRRARSRLLKHGYKPSTRRRLALNYRRHCRARPLLRVRRGE